MWSEDQKLEFVRRLGSYWPALAAGDDPRALAFLAAVQRFPYDIAFAALQDLYVSWKETRSPRPADLLELLQTKLSDFDDRTTRQQITDTLDEIAQRGERAGRRHLWWRGEEWMLVAGGLSILPSTEDPYGKAIVWSLLKENELREILKIAWDTIESKIDKNTP